MPAITINGKAYDYEKGKTILQVATDNGIEIPHYCYHDSLSIVANCRICLAEVWAPNPKNDGKLEPIPKLLPTCQTPAGDGQVVYTDSPKAIQNQKAVMEYLLINHPVDCPVCDQAGECLLQDYSYQYGRGVSRFQEQKIKQPKKDLGPNVLLYSDRCIMCTRCVRFCREVTGTSEIVVEGRGGTEQIDVFPGLALDNELSANVIDICPVGALLDKDFLFQQRVWFLTKTPSIDPLTASGDNLFIEHNEGRIHRIKPRTNMEVNQWWITDEVRYGWKFVHSDDRLTVPQIKGRQPFELAEAMSAYEAAYEIINRRLSESSDLAAMISPMLSCEDAYLLATYVREIDPEATFALGPIPRKGEDKTFPGGFRLSAEKAPNARGVRRVLENLGNTAHRYEELLKGLRSNPETAVILTGNYPSEWVTDDLLEALGDRFVVLIDTLGTRLTQRADVVVPGATWAEKAGTFENVNNRLQAFEQAIEPVQYAKSEAQIAMDLQALRTSERPQRFNAANIRGQMAGVHKLTEFAGNVHTPQGGEKVETDMELVEL